jgi:hypothetical protein
MAFDKTTIDQAVLEQMQFLLEEVEYLHSTGLKWIEAVVQFCEDRSLEVEDVVPILPPSIIQHLKEEGIRAKTIEGVIPKALWN